MATITPALLTPVDENTGGTAIGQAAGWTAAAGGGDTVPLLGSEVILRFRTTGTVAVVTFDSVELSSYGTDVNPAVSLAATDEQEVRIKVGTRFKQVSGNVGNLNLSYSSVVGLSVAAKYIA
jgi:hypothetical protein